MVKPGETVTIGDNGHLNREVIEDAAIETYLANSWPQADPECVKKFIEKLDEIGGFQIYVLVKGDPPKPVLNIVLIISVNGFRCFSSHVVPVDRIVRSLKRADYAKEVSRYLHFESMRIYQDEKERTER